MVWVRILGALFVAKVKFTLGPEFGGSDDLFLAKDLVRLCESF